MWHLALRRGKKKLDRQGDAFPGSSETQKCDAGETPLCTFSGPQDDLTAKCEIRRAKDHRRSFCEGESSDNCPRYQAFKKLDDQANKQSEADRKHSQERVNSLVFNTFIFLQASFSIQSSWFQFTCEIGQGFPGLYGYKHHWYWQNNQKYFNAFWPFRKPTKVGSLWVHDHHSMLASRYNQCLQVFNEVNSRKLKDEINVFAGLWRSTTFIYILLITVSLQVSLQ